jgi:pentatricopeptide repeat protein
MRKLIGGLCLQRSIDDAFEVFDIGMASGVEGDLQVTKPIP